MPEKKTSVSAMKHHLSKTICVWDHKLAAISNKGEINQSWINMCLSVAGDGCAAHTNTNHGRKQWNTKMKEKGFKALLLFFFSCSYIAGTPWSE